MSPATEPLTKTGPIRAGLDYQDSYALFRFVEWLEHPERYLWMRMECTEAGFLDDLVIASTGNHYDVFQIKYSVHPDSPSTDWNWDTLLSKQKNAKKTFLQKWYRSWSTFEDSAHSTSKVTGYLLTNQSASRGFLKYLKADRNQNALRVDFSNLKKAAPSIYDTALKTIGSVQDLRDFLRNFYFVFDQQELSVLKESARLRLESLGVGEAGFRELQDAVRLWATRKDLPREDGTILLEDIKSAASWYRPRPLLQSFPVPNDFVLFNRHTHAELLRELDSPVGGVKVIAGTPGTGKSTYL